MEAETQAQKNLVNFCKYLPAHVERWRSALQEAEKPTQNLSNLCEQRHLVKHVNVKCTEDFDDQQMVLLNQISTGIEDELFIIKGLLEKLNQSNLDLKNKLLIFERSTLNLDWEANLEIIKGNATQPPLKRLLQNSLEFLNFFLKNAKNIGNRFNSLNLDDEKSIRELQEAFNINLDHEVIITLISLTQYVDDTKAIL